MPVGRRSIGPTSMAFGHGEDVVQGDAKGGQQDQQVGPHLEEPVTDLTRRLARADQHPCHRDRRRHPVSPVSVKAPQRSSCSPPKTHLHGYDASDMTGRPGYATPTR
jgi:hypothetical protein